MNRSYITYTVRSGVYVSPWGPPAEILPLPPVDPPPDPTPDFFTLDDPTSSLDGSKVMV